MYILYFLSIIALIFVFHFCMVFIIQKLDITKKIISNNRFYLYIGYNKNLCVETCHYSKSLCKTCNKHFTHSFSIHIAYLYFIFYYGKDDLFTKDINLKQYGFICDNNELFWNNFCWGNKSFKNPFKKYILNERYLFDIANSKLINVSCFNPYSPIHDDGIEFPYISIIKDKTYTNKNNEQIYVDEVKWYIMEKRLINPIFKKTFLKHVLFKKQITLNAVFKKPINGKHEYSYNLNDYPDILRMYKLVTENNNYFITYKLYYDLKKLIEDLMKTIL